MKKERDADKAEEEARLEADLASWHDEEETELRARFNALELQQQQEGGKQRPVVMDSAKLDDAGATAMAAAASPPASPLATKAEDADRFCTPLQHLPVVAEDSMEARMLAALTASTQVLFPLQHLPVAAEDSMEAHMLAALTASTQASAELNAHMTAFDGLMERFQTSW